MCVQNKRRGRLFAKIKINKTYNGGMKTDG